MKLEKEILDWATERDIFKLSSPLKQHEKTLEEVEEIEDAIKLGDLDKIKDGIGDTIVTLVLQANMHGLTIDECVEYAYSEIKNRKGEMVDGLFIKEENADKNKTEGFSEEEIKYLRELSQERLIRYKEGNFYFLFDITDPFGDSPRSVEEVRKVIKRYAKYDKVKNENKRFDYYRPCVC